MISALIEEWQLTQDGAAVGGGRAVVVPVRTQSERPAVLKVGGGDEHEHLALQHWHGRGAVELLRADPHRGALLLERLHREDLTDLWDVEACEIVAGLYAWLHRPAPPQLRSLTSYAEAWSADLSQLTRNAPLPRRMVEQAVALARDFATDPASSGTMIHTDLHYANVLAAHREPWSAIAPKPVSGDPHFEPAPMLLHRFEELAGDIRNGLRRRFHAIVDAAELDEDRARGWVVVRMMRQAQLGIHDTASGTVGADHLTRCIAIAKAVQD